MKRFSLIALFALCAFVLQSPRHPRFEDHAIKVRFKKKPVQLQLDRRRYSDRLSVALQKGAKHGPNFADQYTIIQWPDKSACFRFGVANAITGEFYEFPDIRCGNLVYSRGSRLLIDDPIDSSYYAREKGQIPNYIYTRFYLWTGSTLKQIDTAHTPMEFPYEPSYNFVYQ
jgi:hypothetical protein